MCLDHGLECSIWAPGQKCWARFTGPYPRHGWPGAKVVATTSTNDRAAKLIALGAAHIVNYRTNFEAWGPEAREQTPNARGFDIVIDVGGNQTLPQPLQAVRADGVLLVAGGVGDSTAESVTLFAAVIHT
ncbi:putative polyketide enoylreductase [Rosellinia necatrix]|uniref:Putative polyketide enoylreductase n=1 Tax=Rosellinia necatrix TaxID=77044 RepID=A0A1S8A6U5_ROSNE|nr:putative polyketide enoylreductase [Rosellinia necatrix]